MELSKELGALLGPILIVLSLSEGLNFRIWKTVHPTTVYLNGLILFIGGLCLVRAHNRWAADWTLLVTLIGWTLLTAGALRMFFPNAPQMQEGKSTYIVIAILFFIGVFLTIKSYLV